jgi:hypothetical protein
MGRRIAVEGCGKREESVDGIEEARKGAIEKGRGFECYGLFITVMLPHGLYSLRQDDLFRREKKHV